MPAKLYFVVFRHLLLSKCIVSGYIQCTTPSTLYANSFETLQMGFFT